jgi:integrase
MYLKWRKQQGAKHNTARLEVKHLSFILREAIKRQYITYNPLSDARIEKKASTEKPEITNEQFKSIQRLMKLKPAWMNLIFHVLAYTGVRFKDGNITENQIDFENNIIYLNDSKRKKDSKKRVYSFAITKDFKKFLKKFFKDNPNFSKKLSPSDNTLFNKVLFQATGIKNITSHSNRVSFVTRCHRAGLSIQESMLLVNHSTSTVHDIYSRLNHLDKMKAMSQVAPPL